MGYNSTTVYDCGFEVLSHKKRIKGVCEMCGTPFDIEFDLKEGPDDYECPCGYFRLNADSEHVTEDNHGVPKEKWIARLREKQHTIKCHCCEVTAFVLARHPEDGLYAMPQHVDPKDHMGQMCKGSGCLAKVVKKATKIQKR